MRRPVALGAAHRKRTQDMVRRSATVSAARRLRAELEAHGISADIHEGYGVALISVWVDLLVWCEVGPDGPRYRWWTGRISDRTRRYVYTGCPGNATETAARRIAARYRELRADHPLSPVIVERLAATGHASPDPAGGATR